MERPSRPAKPHEMNDFEEADKDPGERMIWFGDYKDRLKFNQLPITYIHTIMNQYEPEYDQGKPIPHKQHYLLEFMELYHKRHDWLERRGKARSPGKTKIWFGKFEGREVENHLEWLKEHSTVFKTRVFQIEAELQTWKQKQLRKPARESPILSSCENPILSFAHEQIVSSFDAHEENETVEHLRVSQAAAFMMGVALGMLIPCWYLGSRLMAPKNDANALLAADLQERKGRNKHQPHSNGGCSQRHSNEYDDSESEEDSDSSFIVQDSGEVDSSDEYLPDSTCETGVAIVQDLEERADETIIPNSTDPSQSSSDVADEHQNTGPRQISTIVSSIEEELDWARLNRHPKRDAQASILPVSSKLPTPCPEDSDDGYDGVGNIYVEGGRGPQDKRISKRRRLR